MCSSVIVPASRALYVKGHFSSNLELLRARPVISGGDEIRHFVVFGELKLESVILAYGFAEDDGGAILLKSEGTKTKYAGRASARLFRTVIEDCEAYRNGGGISLQGAGTLLHLEGEDVTFERNNARTGSGGAVHISRAATIHIDSKYRDGVTVVKGSDNLAKKKGGGKKKGK